MARALRSGWAVRFARRVADGAESARAADALVTPSVPSAVAMAMPCGTASIQAPVAKTAAPTFFVV